MLSSLVLIASVASQVDYVPMKREQTKAEIQRAYDDWTSSYMRGDIDRLDRLVSSDFVWIADDGKKRDRIDFLGGIMRGISAGVKVTHFTVRIDKLEMTKDGYLATITERAEVGKSKFGQITADGWRKTPNGWQVTSTRLVRRLDK